MLLYEKFLKKQTHGHTVPQLQHIKASPEHTRRLFAGHQQRPQQHQYENHTLPSYMVYNKGQTFSTEQSCFYKAVICYSLALAYIPHKY